MRAFGNPVFSHPAVERLKDLPIREIVTTDTIPIPPHKRLPNLQVLTVSPLLGEMFHE